jgi:hypothetical protein
MSFVPERVIAYGLVGCGIACGAGIVLARYSYYPRAGQPNFMWFGAWLAGFSALVALALILIGLMIAFGVGPKFLARRLQGVEIMERIALLPEGGVLFDVPKDAEGVRRYLRLRLADGHTTEVNCSVEDYAAARVGMRADAVVIGRRLLELYPYR